MPANYKDKNIQYATHILSKSDLSNSKSVGALNDGEKKYIRNSCSTEDSRRNVSQILSTDFDYLYNVTVSICDRKRCANGVPTKDEINGNAHGENFHHKSSVLFPSLRLFVAALLCCCFIVLSVSTSNIAVALICMNKSPMNPYSGDLSWDNEQEGLVLAGQNIGTLLIVITGLWADRISGKWMVSFALLLCLIANIALPIVAYHSFWYAVGARIAVGAADACLNPSVNSLITRWFPQVERAIAIGIITGGRQIGALFILPTAGYLCTRKDILNGWPATFYLCAFITAIVGLFWLLMGADKPSKQLCISRKERMYIESRIACESIGKRNAARTIPWSHMLRSAPLWAAIFALICTEFPLVFMVQFLPNYMRDVLGFSATKNGIFSALPIACLFVSKTISSSLSTWLTRKRKWNRTTICKTFNGTASTGLSLCILMAPQFDNESSTLISTILCTAMIFGGMHTPGVQTALVQLAPPFSGILTGISFFFVACFSIANKMFTKYIVQNGTAEEWKAVFYTSGIVAALPVVVFTLWGSAEKQYWSGLCSKPSAHSISRQETISTDGSI